MKKILFLLPFFLMYFAGCGKIKQLLTFEIPHSVNIKIPASGLISVPFISPVPVSTSSQETFKHNNTSANLVKDVTLSRLTLTIIDPAAESFDFLKSVDIYIEAEGAEKVLLASLDDVPAGASTIELISSNTKLDSYIKASSFTLYTEVTLRSNVARELTVKADARFKVTADPL